MIEKDFDAPKNYRSKYRIITEKNIVWVRYNYATIGFNGDWEKNLYNFCMDIRNIPELIKGIMQVFYGEYGRFSAIEINENGDEIRIICDYEMFSPSYLKVRNNREDLNLEGPFFEFNFNPDQIPTHPVEARIPTPAMVWVTDTLKKIYDDWKDKNGRAVV